MEGVGSIAVEAASGMEHCRMPEEACILIVDDMSANVALLKAVLARAGYVNLHGTSDPRQVIDLCATVRPDLVLLDLHMPEMDGMTVLTALRRVLPIMPLLPVIVLGTDIDAESKRAAINAGATDFLAKPFDHAEVVLRIGNLLTTRSLQREVEMHNVTARRKLIEQADRDGRRARLADAKRARTCSALEGEILQMVFQPIVELETRRVIGCEALARFDHPLQRSPDRWFDEAAEVGLGIDLELAAISLALAELAHLPEGCLLSVNASAATISTVALSDVLASAPGDRLIVEMTEDSIVHNYRDMQDHFDRLRARGTRVAIDDAGTGNVGLQHILRLRPDIVKLDRDLIARIDTDLARRALASALASFATDIGAVLVAEGIETSRELDTLVNLGVPWGQGFLLAAPGPADEVELADTSRRTQTA